MTNLRRCLHVFEGSFSRQSYKYLFGASLLAMSLAIAGSPISTASAQEQTVVQKQYDLTPGPLGKVLNKFASEARITLSFKPSMVLGKEAPALKGSYSVKEGLQALLAKSGLNVVYDGGAYKIELAPQSQSFVLEPINVYGRQKQDSVREIPQNIHVIDEETMDLTQATQVGEVLRLMPSVSRSGSSQDMFADDFRIRGYDSAQTTNGLGFTRADHPTDLANVERIEVLTGPSSVLFGQMEPGGTINVVTKQPLPYFQSTAKAQVGSHNSYRTEFDITGPVNDRVRVRFNAAYEDNESSLDNWGYEHKFFAPNVTVDLTEKTNFTIEGSYSENSWTAINTGTPYEGSIKSNPLGEYSSSFNIASSDSYTNRDSHNVNARLTHELNDSLEARLSYTYANNTSDFMEYYNTGLNADNRTVGRRVFIGDDTERSDHEVIADITGKVKTGPVLHKFIAGMNYRHSDDDRPTKIYSVGSVDLFNPTYTNSTLLAANRLRDRTTLQEDTVKSVFLQDRMTWDKFHLLTGLRYIDSEQSQTTINNTTSARSIDQISQKDWTTQFGLVYDVTKQASVYASRSESFVPQQGTTSGQKPLEAEEGIQYEIGTKFDFGDVQASVAGYILTKDNIAIEDPNDANFNVAEGQSRSKGIETSVSGQVLPELYLAFNYGYTRTEIRKSDDASLVGNDFANVPKHTASLQGRYDVEELPGFSLGTTVAYVGERYVDDENTNKLSGHTRVDLGAYYSLNDNLQIDFLANNIFDQEIYSPGSINGIVREEGRTFKINLAYTF